MYKIEFEVVHQIIYHLVFLVSSIFFYVVITHKKNWFLITVAYGLTAVEEIFTFGQVIKKFFLPKPFMIIASTLFISILIL